MKKQSLIDAARGTGTQWLMAAISGATDSKNALERVTVVQLAASHILAACAYNLERDKIMKGEDVLEEFFVQAQNELNNLRKEAQGGNLVGISNPPPQDSA